MSVSENNHQAEIQHLSQRVEELQRQLKEEQAETRKWRELAEHAPGYIYKIDRDYRIAYVNKVDDPHMIDQIEGRSCQELTAPEDWPRIAPLFQQVFEQGKLISYQARQVQTGIWYECIIAPIMESGKVLYAMGVSQNIQERKEQELQLQESQARLQLLLNQIPAVIWTTDRDLIVRSSVGSALDKLNVKQHEFEGKKLTDILQTNDFSNPVLAALQDALAGKTTVLEQPYQEIEFETIIAPMRNQQNEIIGCIAFSLDITERKKHQSQLENAQEELLAQRDSLEKNVTERTKELNELNLKQQSELEERKQIELALRESEERFRVISESSPIPILICKQGDGQFLYANHSFSDTFRFPLKNIEEFYSPNFYHDLEMRQVLLDQLKTEGSLQAKEVQLYRGDGQSVWVSLYVRPIRYKNQAATLLCALDISNRKQTELSLEKERRLLRKLLDLHDRDRQLIAYEIHDGVVQDMSGALMFIEAAERQLQQNDPEGLIDLHKGYRLLRTCIAEARLIIDGLRPPVLEEAGVIPAVENLVTELTYASGIEIELTHNVKFDRIAPALEIAIYRIIQESLHNVTQHSEADAARISLNHQERSIEIKIEDKGIGFDPDKVKKRRYGIEGIKERARLLEGKASIESKLGYGTTVEVKLPLTDTLLPKSEN